MVKRNIRKKIVNKKFHVMLLKILIVTTNAKFYNELKTYL